MTRFIFYKNKAANGVCIKIFKKNLKYNGTPNTAKVPFTDNPIVLPDDYVIKK